jgi:hypothetical protein
MLAAWVDENAGEEPDLTEAVARRRAVLQGEALALGERLYAEKPSAYVRRLERLWSDRRTQVRAP